MTCLISNAHPVFIIIFGALVGVFRSVFMQAGRYVSVSVCVSRGGKPNQCKPSRRKMKWEENGNRIEDTKEDREQQQQQNKKKK